MHLCYYLDSEISTVLERQISISVAKEDFRVERGKFDHNDEYE
jgi:hypothetical protein